ncbi:MAG: CBS domain-containing protein [Clostridiales bacterium]|nr:CBS domain-containing protein [Clostridiales bacterium]
MSEENIDLSGLSNSQRFLLAFNDIDYAIKTRFNFNRSMGFSEAVRKAVAYNYTIRKFEDDLITYGRLRNAIVHGNDDFIIAEPHIDVVEKIEKIKRLLTTPPRAIDVVARRDVLMVHASKSMREVIKLIASSSYSNIPVFNDNNQIIGIANGQKILDSFGKYLLSDGKSETFLDAVKIEDMLSKIENTNYYAFANSEITVEQALSLFHQNSKLLAIIVTTNGGANEKPLGIMTGSDVLKMNKILENY